MPIRDIKTKKLLLFGWIAAAVLAGGLAAKILIFPTAPTPNQTAVEAAVPQVLGQATSIRGLTNQSSGTWIANTEVDPKGLSAKGFFVYDLESGQALLSKNSKTKLPIASLTKLMTGLIIYEQADFGSFATVNPADQVSVQPGLNLKLDDRIKIYDLFNAMLIGSCNDAAQTLANHVRQNGQSDFVTLMNQEATDLGMNNTNYNNPLGFDSSDNYSTAEDLALLVNKTQSLAAFTNLGKMTGYSFASELKNKYYAQATNKLVGQYADIEAVKTGFTQSAQGSMITKINFQGRKIIIIVLGSQDREQDTLGLKKLVEQNYQYQ